MNSVHWFTAVLIFIEATIVVLPCSDYLDLFRIPNIDYNFCVKFIGFFTDYKRCAAHNRPFPRSGHQEGSAVVAGSDTDPGQ